MLDNIARTAQERLRRERAEHSQYQEHLETQVRVSMDENARLASALHQLETEWTQRLEEQQQRQQQQQDDAGLTHDSSYANPHGSPDQHSYYYEYDTAPTARHSAVSQSVYVHYPTTYYSASDTDAQTPTDDASEFFYSNDTENNGAVSLEQSEHDDEQLASAGTITPPVSPTRVGAVWNRFFENMASVSDARDDRMQLAVAPPPPSSRTSQSLGVPSRGAAVLMSASSVFMAIRKSDMTQLQQLLLSGMSPNVRDLGEKGTPLHLAYVQQAWP